MTLAVCADVGSTFTKVAVVDLAGGGLVATAAHPTTVDTDVLDGLDAAVAAAGAPRAAPTYVCSSAGGGLRLAVVGYERLVTAEAGQRVGLTAGARVVHVAAGPLDGAGVRALRAARPDVLLLVGGTDGGDAEVLTHNARRLAAARLRVPVVLAGNADAREEVLATLGNAVATGNVLPRIGDLRPEPARAAIREVYLRHVIGGKRLSRHKRFARLVRAPTPDAVLTGVGLLAEVAGDLLVVDVGGATTDVYSVLTPAESTAESTDVAGTLWRERTVEGDLGMRWGAEGVVTASRAEDLVGAGEEPGLRAAAGHRVRDPGFLACTDEERAVDVTLARLAATVAVRRHARGRRILSTVRLLVGSGGVLRHDPSAAAAALAAVSTDHAGGWALPRAAGRVVDTAYVLAPAGLLTAEHPEAARALVASLVR